MISNETQVGQSYFRRVEFDGASDSVVGEVLGLAFVLCCRFILCSLW